MVHLFRSVLSVGIFSFSIISVAGPSVRTAYPIIANGEAQNVTDAPVSFSFVVPVTAGKPFEIDNSYGELEVLITDSPTNEIRLTGSYSSDSRLHADIQHVSREKRESILVDGPAQFKSHDHTSSYGKPLDRAFFERNVGTVPGVEAGREAGDIVIGGALTLRGSGGSQISGHSVMWGSMSFGSEISLGDGACYGLEKANVKLQVQIPASLFQELSLTAKKGSAVTLNFQSEKLRARFETKSSSLHRIDVKPKDGCGNATANG